MIVTEATPGYEAGELYKLTSGWRKLAGHQIYCFNPSDMTSHRINPIDRIRQAPHHERRDGRIQKRSDMEQIREAALDSAFDACGGK
jgi:type IV secretory pathway TraG/TraD family ATPase VirD4